MVIEFTTTYSISAYHHKCCEFESQLGRGVRHHVIKFISDFATGQWFSPVSSTNKTDRHDITETLLKVALNTINSTNVTSCYQIFDNHTIVDMFSNVTSCYQIFDNHTIVNMFSNENISTIVWLSKIW
jgi:hypothetical protein